MVIGNLASQKKTHSSPPSLSYNRLLAVLLPLPAASANENNLFPAAAQHLEPLHYLLMFHTIGEVCILSFTIINVV